MMFSQLLTFIALNRHASRTRSLSLRRFVAASLLLLPLTALAADAPNLLPNGGFEKGMDGWGYEQWAKKPLPGVIDKADHAEGAASFKMGLPGGAGGRYLSRDIPLTPPARDYTLTFYLKAQDVPANAAHVRVGIEGKGWLGSAQGKSEAAQAGGTFDWKQFTVAIPAGAVGDAKKLTLFFYHDQIGQGILGIDGVALTAGAEAPATAAVPAAAAGAASAAEPEDNTGNLVSSGGFEDGTKGWMWEQWANKPLPGVIDKQDRIRGAASFKMGLAGATGGRYLAQEIKLADPNKNYLLKFWLKCDGVPANAAYVRVGIDGKGWLGASEGKADVVRTGGSFAWKQFSIPIAAAIVGEATKLTLFFYDDQIGQGSVGIDAVSLKIVSEEDLADAAVGGGTALLTGDTNHPDLSTFIKDEPVQLSFRASNLGKAAQDVKLLIEILDEHDQQIEKQEVPLSVEKGAATATIKAPSDKFGFYRVKARLSTGLELAAVGSRKAGFLTYCVVPDPAQRQNYGEMESRFAMQGGFGPWADKVLAYMGSRWVLDSGLEWRKNEPDHAGQFAAAIAAGKAPKLYKGSKWQIFTLPTLMASPNWAIVPGTCPYMTGVLTPEGEKAWADYCRLAATLYAQQHPDRKEHIYQITWEPIYPWGFKGRNEDLVRIYEIAYRVLHEADPKAVVAGPCRGINKGDVQLTIPILQLGLGKYMDMYSTHPYFSIDAEKDGMPREMRRMKQALDQYTGKKDMPMIGTEQGWTTNEEVDKELTMARGLLRQNLITLGEGYRFNFAYYIVDYRLSEQKGYGYYYNLVPGVPWAPAKASPRPIAPAYAAQSFLLDGHRSVGAIEWLGSTALGYAFQRDAHVVLALWDYGDQPREVSLPTGAEKVTVYDWMGNQRTVSGPAGNIQVTIGPEPIYIAGVSPNIWGDVSGRMLSVDADQLQVFPGGRVKLTGKVRASDKPFHGQVALDMDQRLGAKPASQSISVNAGSVASYAFEWDVPAGTSAAVLPVKLTLAEGQTQIAAAGASVRLTSPLDIIAVDPALTAGQRGVAVTLTDAQGKGFDGSLEVELAGISGSKQQVPVKLAPKATSRFVVSYPKLDVPASRICQAKTTVTSGAGAKFSHTEPIDFLAATRAGKLTIDGDPADWTGAPAVHLAGKEMVIRSREYFREDFSAALRYAWDEQALYLLAEVSDPVFYQPFNGAMTWKGDSLQLAFNLDPRMREAKTGNLLDTNIIRRACEINVALTKDGPEAFRSVSWDAAAAPLNLIPAADCRVAVKQQGDKLVYEIAIPWKTLGATAAPREGDLVGVALTVNDNDSAEQKDPTALGLFGGIVPEKDSEKFGLLLLSGK